MERDKQIVGVISGLFVGDALGVPCTFQPQTTLPSLEQIEGLICTMLAWEYDQKPRLLIRCDHGITRMVRGTLAGNWSPSSRRVEKGEGTERG